MNVVRAALLLLSAAAALHAAEPGVAFTGVLTADGKTRIALTDRASHATTWVEPGDTLADGYTVARYDAEGEAIFLKKNGEEIRLGLTPAKTAEPARATLAGQPTATPVRNAPPPPAPVAATAATTPAAPAPMSSGSPPSSAPPPVSPPAADANTTVAATPTAPPPAETSLTPTGRQPASPTHVVQGGDTLDSIALVHGVTVERIRELNPTLASTSLRAGDTIRVR